MTGVVYGESVVEARIVITLPCRRWIDSDTPPRPSPLRGEGGPAIAVGGK